MTTPAASVPFDTRALTEPVDRAAIKAHKQHLVASGRAPSDMGLPVAAIILIVVGVIMMTGFGSLGAVFFSIASATGGGFGLLALLPLLLVGAVFTIVIVAIVRFGRGQGERRYRLDRFAASNGLTFYPEAKNPPLPGLIFHQGSARTASEILRGGQPRWVEFANYRYTTGSGKNSTTHKWGYIAIRLNAPLPHIVLDAVGNNGLLGSNLPASFDKDQRLSLEGDFDRYFTLYCPAGYERDALYLFTPDIMARFIDNAAALDVEIVDDWLFLYARRDFSTLDPRMWAWLFSVVGAMLDKLAQWERWRDERLIQPEQHAHALATAQAGHAAAQSGHAPAGGAQTLPFTPPTESLRPPLGVAQQGQRLRHRVPWAAIVAAGVFGLLWLGMQLGMQTGLFGLLGGMR